MPKYIIKLTDNNKDYYLEWSTIVDAPITYGYSLEQFKKYYIKKYGTDSQCELEERLSRCEKDGCSAYPPYDKVDELIKGNRAGNNETYLSREEIIRQYCTELVT